MVSISNVVASTLVALTAAAGITYFSPPLWNGSDPGPVAGATTPDVSTVVDTPARRLNNEKAATDFLLAAQAILRKAPTARASLHESDELPIAGPVPLPRRRPIRR
jgi:hypothetical protein